MVYKVAGVYSIHLYEFVCSSGCSDVSLAAFGRKEIEIAEVIPYLTSSIFNDLHRVY
jgi:hypothetical protein